MGRFTHEKKGDVCGSPLVILAVTGKGVDTGVTLVTHVGWSGLAPHSDEEDPACQGRALDRTRPRAGTSEEVVNG
ncbi:hypothetical protein Acsp03_43340 [Actinomadura sp. NBRC 104412]|nr:hypothetical protein Acsp03_43340 [Actinomadura sp. NBRC 104412]